jgi:hypothetical protein
MITPAKIPMGGADLMGARCPFLLAIVERGVEKGWGRGEQARPCGRNLLVYLC